MANNDERMGGLKCGISAGSRKSLMNFRGEISAGEGTARWFV